MRSFIDCKTEKEKQEQELRDAILQHMYYQLIDTRSEVAYIKKTVKRIERKLNYVGATQEEREFLNADGTVNYESIIDKCNRVIDLFEDKYREDIDYDKE